jgi:hypothetical protein
MLAFFLFFGAFIALFIVVSLRMAVQHTSTSSPHHAKLPHDATLPHIPRTAAQAHATMSDKEFELFSAALVIALGEGHRFRSHSGGAGDHGVDTTLHNIVNNRIIVQSKRYAYDNPVTPTQVRDFWGALSIHDAVYGFFVTTSTFTGQSAQTAQWSRGRIRCIDGHRIDALLQYRSREIALAYKDVLDAIPKEE